LRFLSGSAKYVNMAAIISDNKSEALSEARLRRAIELLFFAYRDFTGEADAVLARYGFGRAHHRVIYFVGRHPGTTVSELLAILRITKQSLARVLRELVLQGFIRQDTDRRDMRRRRLSLTGKGRSLERQLTRLQSRRIAAAFAAASADAVKGFDAVLLGIVNPIDRRRFDGG
jgi:DNA-binding MarR family transcriptional regulator